MNRRKYRNEIDVVIGELIHAILDYWLNRPLTRAVIMTLLTGGIGCLGVSPIWAFIDKNMTWFEPVSFVSGGTLIALGLGIYGWDRFKGIGPEMRLEPNSSFFEAHKRSGDKGDPKYIVGRGFSITAYVTILAQRKKVFIRHVALFAFDRGIHCLPMTQSVCVDGQRVKLTGDYDIEPALALSVHKPVVLEIQRDFGPPFMGRGAPIDFGNAELLMTVDYMVAGKSRPREFCFSSDYNRCSLNVINAISDIPYLNDRDLAFWHRKEVITTGERDALLALNSETRLRVAESARNAGRFANNYRVALSTVKLIRSLRDRHMRCRLPKLDPNAIWRTPFGRLCRLMIRALRWLAARTRSR